MRNLWSKIGLGLALGLAVMIGLALVADVRAVGLNLGDWGSGRLSRLINPLIDLSDLPLRLDVTAVRVEGRSVRLDAEGDATTFRP